jgi:hypothetical protein
MRRRMSDHSKVYGFGEIRFTESAKVGPSVSYVGPLASTIDLIGRRFNYNENHRQASSTNCPGGAGHLVREIAPLNRQSCCQFAVGELRGEPNGGRSD